jgi:carbamoyl-phosphate synthase large subunit
MVCTDGYRARTEMSSTGEVAAFGKDIYEAYWASLLSTTGFKPPRPNSGVLLGGDTRKPEMASIAKILTESGFKLYCSSVELEEYLNGLPYVVAKRIRFPGKDKRKLREVFDEFDVQCVINLADGRAKDVMDEDYIARRCAPHPQPLSSVYGTDGVGRNAVDFGLPLLNNPRTALLFVEAMKRKIPHGGLRRYEEGRIPSEVRSWAEFVGHKG